MENYSQGLNETLNEAMNVRIELESIMEDAVQITQNFADKFEAKINQTPETSESVINMDAAAADSVLEDRLIPADIRLIQAETQTNNNDAKSSSPRIRIYQLAKDLRMSNKELIRFVNGLGIQVNSHMNALDELQLHQVIQAIASGAGNKQNRKAVELQELDQKPTLFGNKLNSVIKIEDFESYDTASADNRGLSLEQPLEGLAFSIDELKNAHPYIAVKTMYDNGYTVRDIAKMLDRGQGEINLILNLSKKRTSVI